MTATGSPSRTNEGARRMAVVVMTGSNSGIGLEGALAFGRAGDRVYATMRNPARAADLQRTAAAERLDITVMGLDVTRADTFPTLVHDILADAGSIDVLVNNAGVNQTSAFEDTPEATLRQVMETNCIGPLLLTQAVLPCMRRQRSGVIIMMSSLSGVAGLPGDVAYTASKFALEGATEALRHEVDRWGIRVALVEAGLYATRIFDNSLRTPTTPLSSASNSAASSPYTALVEHRLRGMRARMPAGNDPRELGSLFVQIARSQDSRLRWPADETACRVLQALLAGDDASRDEFLRKAAGCDWWSEGRDAP